MSRLERLVNLSAALFAAERPLTAEQLRERVLGYPEEKASFRRQFERDKDALRELTSPKLRKSLATRRPVSAAPKAPARSASRRA